jgi:hypothetical protein
VRDYVPPWRGIRFVYVDRLGMFDILDLGAQFPTYMATAASKEHAEFIVNALREGEQEG